MAGIIAVAAVSFLLAVGWPVLLHVHDRRLRAREHAVARSGGRVDLAHMLSRSTYRELSAMLAAVVEREERKLATRVVVFSKAGPLLVQSATSPPGASGTIKLSFANGWQLTLIGIAYSTRQRLIRAVERGLWLAAAEAVGSCATRVDLSWDTAGGKAQTLCRVAALTSPANESFS